MARLKYPGPRCPRGCFASAKQLSALEHRSLPSRYVPAEKLEPARTGFFDLSIELRDHIYSYALVSSSPLFLGVVSRDEDGMRHWHRPGTFHHRKVIRERCTHDDFTPPYHSHYAQNPGEVDLPVKALATCHQFNEEGAKILYGRNEFVVDYSVGLELRSSFPHWELSDLALNTLLPINSTYQDLLREMTFRLHSPSVWH